MYKLLVNALDEGNYEKNKNSIIQIKAFFSAEDSQVEFLENMMSKY